MTTAPLRVDVFADIVCPWCFIGRKRLKDALAEVPGASDASISHHTFLLDPTVPKEGLDLRATLARKYGGDPARMFKGVEAAAADAGLFLDFSKIQRMPSTLNAHTLLRHSLAKGTQAAFLDALYDAYFMNAQDIGDVNTLISIAAKHGFEADDAAALLADTEEEAQTRNEAAAASQGGIQGVPFFVFNEELAFSGAQPLAVFKQVLDKVLAKPST